MAQCKYCGETIAWRRVAEKWCPKNQDNTSHQCLSTKPLQERMKYQHDGLRAMAEKLCEGVPVRHIPEVLPLKLKLTSRYHKYETTKNLLKPCQKCGNLRPLDHFLYKGMGAKSGKHRRGRICVQCRQTKNTIRAG